MNSFNCSIININPNDNELINKVILINMKITYYRVYLISELVTNNIITNIK